VCSCTDRYGSCTQMRDVKKKIEKNHNRLDNVLNHNSDKEKYVADLQLAWAHPSI
jgi:hypothetical protein